MAISLLRGTAGPFWHWFSIDPNWRYLLDSLSLLDFVPPGNVDHPGTPIQWMGALTIKAMHPFAGATETTDLVLADPDHYLRAILSVFTVFVASAILLAGLVADRVFRSISLALLVQAGPFLSRVIIGNAIDVKPVPMLIATVLILLSLVMLAISDGMMGRRRDRFAVGFGVIAGFGVALKVTAAPIFVMPLFLLGRLRPILIYGVVSLLAFLLFVSPMISEMDRFFDWMLKVAMGSGAYGGGDATIINTDTYLASVYKLFSRPVMWAPLALSLGVLGWNWKRARSGRGTSRMAVRAVAGVVVAQFVSVLIIAKHPSAHYVVPVMVFSGFSLALALHVIGGWREADGKPAKPWSIFIWVLLAVLLASRVNSFPKLDRELTEKRTAAEAMDSGRFDQCLRVSTLFASSKAFAFSYGDYIAQGRFSERLNAILPKNDYWFVGFKNEFRNAAGEAD
ncbi:MAG: hypothetical protein OQK53_02610, partial [Rhodospirillales bacterium]|nr:hypothetical protein [Rhodospirillales bacterium]